MELRHFATL